MNRLADKWMRTLNQSVPFFLGLGPKQMQQLQEICTFESRAAGEVLCSYGSRSQQLFVLVKGQLEVLAQDGTHLAEIRPIATVGEMGFITRKLRSATVKVQLDSQFLVLEYLPFKSLLEEDLLFQARIYRNMVRLLSDRLSDANSQIVRYRRLCESQAAPEAEVEPPAPVVPEAAAPEEPAPAQVLSSFYQLVGQEPDPEQLREDCRLYQALLQTGYSAEDIRYAIQWTVNHIPMARRFNMVKLSIGEAFEDKWSS